MKKRFVLIGLLCLFCSSPLWAGEELMSRLFFQQWLNNALRPLTSSIQDLTELYADLAEQAQELQARYPTEIRVVIGEKMALRDGVPVELEVAPLLREGRTLVPVRFIGEALGADFLWEEETQKVTYFCGDLLLEIFIGQKEAFLNREKIILDAPPLLLEGRTLVPLRFVSEQMQAQVIWEEATRTVTIIQ